MTTSQHLQLSDAEMEVVRQIAAREGISVDLAATQLIQKEIARRVRKRTGKAPGKVYSIKKR